MAKRTIARKCLDFAQLFEAELLTELMFRFWQHPLADDLSFRRDLLEAAVEVLRASTEKQRLIEDLPPDQMNFVAALWYAEWTSITNSPEEDEDGGRRAWLERVRRSVPSCFCPQDRLR